MGVANSGSHCRALKYELHIPTVVIPGSDHNPPSNQGGIHENQA